MLPQYGNARDDNGRISGAPSTPPSIFNHRYGLPVSIAMFAFIAIGGILTVNNRLDAGAFLINLGILVYWAFFSLLFVKWTWNVSLQTIYEGLDDFDVFISTTIVVYVPILFAAENTVLQNNELHSPVGLGLAVCGPLVVYAIVRMVR